MYLAAYPDRPCMPVETVEDQSSWGAHPPRSADQAYVRLSPPIGPPTAADSTSVVAAGAVVAELLRRSARRTR